MDANIVSDSKAGEIWSVALDSDGQTLVSSSYDGHVNVWDAAGEGKRLMQLETKGSFGLTIDIVRHTLSSIAN